MTNHANVPGVVGGIPLPLRIAASMLWKGSAFGDLADFDRWWESQETSARADRIALDRLVDWRCEAVSGNIGHASGKFFTVEGVDVHSPDNPVPRWQQPIIHQPETGILGILVKEMDGVLHFLMQAKAEPGNRNGTQLSPTVQATRSNYTRVHGGSAVPYLDYFRDTAAHHVIVDVRQSEQGSWFYRKRNRNMVVETIEDVPLLDGFRWLPLSQILQLLAREDIVNMDTRTVLSCLPLTGPGMGEVLTPHGDAFRSALARSMNPGAPATHSLDEILSWITDARSRPDIITRPLPLDGLRDWHRTEGRISHETGRFFGVIGVDVTAAGREVRTWTQPMIEPYGTGLIAFLAREFDGVLHVLVRQRPEPGFLDVAELGPTVQCTPENYDVLPAAARPPFLDEVLRAEPGRVRYDVILSEEGGRFYHALNRYVIVESDAEVPARDPDFRWLAVHQLVELLRHSHYVSVQARSLLACLYSTLVR